MPPVILTIIRIITILMVELVAFFFFYNRSEGRKAVYFSWYAWVIDVVAVFSGALIMGWSIYALHHPELFTVSIPAWIFWLTFLVGSWQAAIHLVKFVIRTGKSREEK